MNKLILAVGADDKYLDNPHLKNYFVSIDKNSNFDENVLVYLGNNKPQNYFNKIKIFNVNPIDIIKNNTNNCIQHGEFLNCLEFKNFSDDDIIIFTDGDMTLQRSLTNDEIIFLRNLKDNDVYVGYNKSPNDTLEDEYFRLSPKKHIIPSNLKIENIKVYNTGVLCMNKRTWFKLRDLYIENFDNVNNLFNHYAKQQWLICYILGTENFNIIEMPYDVHNHTHYPSPIGTTIENGVVKYNNKTVLFKHRWF